MTFIQVWIADMCNTSDEMWKQSTCKGDESFGNRIAEQSTKGIQPSNQKNVLESKLNGGLCTYKHYCT